MHAQSLSCVLLFAIAWTVACQGPLSMGFSRQEYWSGLAVPTLGDLLNPGIKPASLASPTLAGRFFTTAPPGHSKKVEEKSISVCHRVGSDSVISWAVVHQALLSMEFTRQEYWSG